MDKHTPATVLTTEVEAIVGIGVLVGVLVGAGLVCVITTHWIWGIFMVLVALGIIKIFNDLSGVLSKHIDANDRLYYGRPPDDIHRPRKTLN